MFTEPTYLFIVAFPGSNRWHHIPCSIHSREFRVSTRLVAGERTTKIDTQRSKMLPALQYSVLLKERNCVTQAQKQGKRSICAVETQKPWARPIWSSGWKLVVVEAEKCRRSH